MNYDKVPELPDTSARPWRRRRKLALVAVLVLGGSAAWWWLMPPTTPVVTASAREENVRLEERVQTVALQLAALPEDAPGRRNLLEEAVAAQGELMRRRQPPAPGDALQLSDWQAKLDEAVARERNEQIRALAEEADQLLKRKETDAALGKLKEALHLQRQVNGGLTDRQTKSYGREAQLQQRVEELEAEPLAAEGRQAQAEARAAAEGARWADARRLYRRAQEIQRQLNRDYPHSRFSDLLAESRLEAEFFSVGANEAGAQLETLLQQAEDAAKAGRVDEADGLYGQAAEQQQAINTRFPRSSLVSPARLGQIETARQTLRLKPMLAEVAGLDGRAAEHLRRREIFQAQQLITQALVKLEAGLPLAPKAQGLDEELRARLNYLGRRAGDLVTIQDETYALLLPLPGRPEPALLKTAVPQSLFVLVMNDNPSRNAEPARPVDTVNYAEAGEFCRRLGWVMGAVVRLPTAAERQAAGRDPGPGGLGEWLAAEAGDPATAPVLAPDGTPQTAPRTERSPTTGFRVVVGVDLLAPVKR
jgi:HPt (histidine-containing phosphotransfer) domain-containing protein